MIRRLGVLLLTLPVAAAVSAGSAQAQYYPAPPPGYYRTAPPPGAYYEERLPPPGYYADDDEVVARPPRRSPRAVQGQNSRTSPIRPYPEEVDDEPLPPPGFITPDGRPPAYGRQVDPQGPPPAARNDPRNDPRTDPYAIRPPGAVGNAPEATPRPASPSVTSALPPEDQPEVGAPTALPENLRKQLVDYSTKEPAGTIIVDTANTYLYLALGNGKAMRYGVRVGRDGFTWTGTERISKMTEWPDWHPPAEMIERQPYLPRFMAGGNGNPLGARAMYLGKTLYRIHGTNQPSTIGHYVSSGCVGMLNEDVEDLFSRVQVGTRVVVLPGRAPDAVANSGAPPEPANPMAPPPRPGAAVSNSQLPPTVNGITGKPLPPPR